VLVAAYYDGTFYTNADWDEGGNEMSVANLDTLIIQNGGGYSHGWGLSGGTAITANSLYTYQSNICDAEGGHLYDSNPLLWPPYTVIDGIQTNYAWSGFVRKNRSDLSLAAVESGLGIGNCFNKISQYVENTGNGYYRTSSGIDANLKYRHHKGGGFSVQR
jgi:hypothetical protein